MPTEQSWQHPWLRIVRLLRAMLETRWNTARWDGVKSELGNALAERARIAPAGWFS